MIKMAETVATYDVWMAARERRIKAHRAKGYSWPRCVAMAERDLEARFGKRPLPPR